MKKKTLAMIVALVLVFALGVGGTLAWLKVQTSSVTNTFSPSTINITLGETKGPNYEMVPGKSVEKDPLVTVKAGSEKCYVFVKVEEIGEVDKFLTYGIRTGDNEWSELQPGVYYRVVDESNEDQPFYVLTGDNTYPNGKVTTNSNITKSDMDGLTTNPQIKFTAYAIQFEGFNDAAAAWIEAAQQ